MAERFLDALTPEEVAHLHERGVVRRFPRGTALFHERQVSDRVMLLTQGRVKIASISDDGRESVLAFRGPGEVLGELIARLREADRKRAEFGASDTIGRVAARLVELAEE